MKKLLLSALLTVGVIAGAVAVQLPANTAMACDTPDCL